MQHARRQVHEVAGAQLLHRALVHELHHAFDALHRGLARGLVFLHRFAHGQHHADDLELTRLQDGGGDGFGQVITQRANADDLAGLGVGLVPDYVVADDVAQGLVNTALSEWRLSIFGTRMFLLRMPNRYQTLAARTLIDFITQKVRAWAA